MIDSEATSQERRGCAPVAADILAFLHSLALPSPSETDAERIDRIAAMERLKSALGAAQARETAAFQVSQQAALQGASFETRHEARSVATQVALARRVSPHVGSRLVGLATALVTELPHTLAALSVGDCSEWQATVVARETACLSAADRGSVDEALAADLPTLSDRQVQGRARALAYELDPHAFLDRHRLAVADRRVSLRPAPDGMTLLSALLPLTAGVGCLAALKDEAARLRATGDDRSEGQVMADTLVERLTGASSPDAVPVEIQLIMTDSVLLGESDTPAAVPGHGPMPAPLARQLVRDIPDDAKSWVRRLYADPVDGRLTGLDTRRRSFDGALRKGLILRDDHCRMPFCDGAIKHLDHVLPRSRGGPTSAGNGQGLCESCNYVKQQPGWQARPDPRSGAGAAVAVTTPTGHSYLSRPPPLPHAARVRPESRPRGSLHRMDVVYVGAPPHAA